MSSNPARYSRVCDVRTKSSDIFTHSVACVVGFRGDTWHGGVAIRHIKGKALPKLEADCLTDDEAIVWITKQIAAALKCREEDLVFEKPWSVK